MPSIRSRFLTALLANRHLLSGHWKRPPITKTTSVALLREQTEASARRFGRLPTDVRMERAGLATPSAEWLRLRGAREDAALLFLHGGCYVMGSARAHRHKVAKVVRACGVDALVVDYRLAPEHPFPAALNDATAAYEWLLGAGLPSSRVVVAGDSAGGGLALALLLALRDRGQPLPGAAVALSPWTDLLATGPSYAQRDPLVPDGAWDVFGGYYAGGVPRDHPLISPLYGALHGLPPLFISVGDRENLLDDATHFTEKARAEGVDARLVIGRGQVHCYPLFAPLFPEARDALRELGAFVRGRLD